MKEKRNELMNKMEAMFATETRSFEKAEFDAIADEVRSLDKKIKMQDTNTKKGESFNMDKEKQELELRGFTDFLRRKQSDEQRALSTTADGGAVIPKEIAKEIVTIIEESSPVFALATKFNSVNGDLRIPKENDSITSGFVGEANDVVEGKLGFTEVSLTSKRVGSAGSVSNKLVQDSAVEIVPYVTSLLAKRASKAIEKSILTGAGATEFKGIVKDADVLANSPVAVDAIDYNALIKVYASVKPAYLNGSVFIIQRKAFNAIMLLEDGNKHKYVQNGVVNGVIGYTLLGIPVYVTDALTDETPLVFGNVTEGYAMMVKRGFAIQHVIADTTQAMRGSQLLVLDGYMDGAVKNGEALAVLRVTSKG